MEPSSEEDELSAAIAGRWCAKHASTLGDRLGKGGTAPVFEIRDAGGVKALKVYDAKFSKGEQGAIESKRINQQLLLNGHGCRSLVEVHAGGTFEDRLFLVMSRAEGQELEKRLTDIPRSAIRTIIQQVAEAAICLRERSHCHRDIKSANVYVSDDFRRATLLDVSVVRDINDPVGIGTDHDGQLPVLATARYSPPEYLFRLLDPGPSLWHALTVYQLGGLLHDLIMRRSLFEDEYQKSKANRYRFAWIIATTPPLVTADDVDGDLVLLARRALDKSWERRSTVMLESFLDDPRARQARGLQTLGLRRVPSAKDDDAVGRHERIETISAAIEGALLEYLNQNNALVVHKTTPGQSDTTRNLSFEWTIQSDPASLEVSKATLTIMLSLVVEAAGLQVATRVTLTAPLNGKQRENVLDLAPIGDEAGVATQIGTQSIAAFEQLAGDIFSRT